MNKATDRKAIWGWMLFDFASQPFYTLLVTFIFAPYFTASVAQNSIDGQAAWAFTTGAAGIVIAILAPVLGAMADTTGPRKPWIAGFSVLYIIGTLFMWQAVPNMPDATFVLLAFAVAMIGIEFSTTFSNAMLPDLAPHKEIGRISGSGWALGYVGGLIVLIFVLLLVAENDAGLTLLGTPPMGGLDPEMREGTRAVAPISAVWYLVFMVPFVFWVPDAPRLARSKGAVGRSLKELWQTIRNLPGRRNFLYFLIASTFYRDALIGGLYAFGGIFAAGVLGWTIVQIGVFGILAALTGAIGAWAGGYADRAFGPKPIILVSIFTLLIVSIICIGTDRTGVYWLTVTEGSTLPDTVFYICGAIIGAAGGAIQAASRTMLVYVGDRKRMTEAFGLYALTGKATAFITPFSIGLLTTWTGNQQIGTFAPVIVLFLIGIAFLLKVNTNDVEDGPDAI